LLRGELIVSFEVEVPRDRRGSFHKLGPRRANAVAKVSAAASARVGVNDTLEDTRLFLGSVGPTMVRAREVEECVNGAPLTAEVLEEVRTLVECAITPIDDARSTASYRRKTAGVLAQRALRSLLRP